MSVSKERRDAIRRELDDPSVDFEPYDSTVRALLDLADERDRYRAALEKIATGRITGEQKHSDYASELRARIAQEAIDAALEGNDGD